jgi:hypothetical protein
MPITAAAEAAAAHATARIPDAIEHMFRSCRRFVIISSTSFQESLCI